MLNQDFKEFIQSINDNGVRYLVGVDFETCFASRVEVDIDGIKVFFHRS
jgi:hypothetical protein